jgi:hypothetical protein
MIEYVQYYMCCRPIYEFIYVYYGSFICTNLVDIMLLFFTGFFVPFTNFWQKSLDFSQNLPANHHGDLSLKSPINHQNRPIFSILDF